MANKTLMQFKDEAAKEGGYIDFEDLKFKNDKDGQAYRIRLVELIGLERYRTQLEFENNKLRYLLNRVISLRPLLQYDVSAVTYENKHEAAAVTNMFDEISYELSHPQQK